MRDDTRADKLDAVRALAAKLDETKVSKLLGYPTRMLADYLDLLLNHGRVEVGYRATCGGGKHSSFKIYDEWVRVLKALRKAGVVVNEQTQLPPNRYPTNNGGWWNATLYTLARPAESEAGRE